MESGDADCGRSYKGLNVSLEAGTIWEIFVISPHFFSESKTVLKKNKALKRIIKEKKKKDRQNTFFRYIVQKLK